MSTRRQPAAASARRAPAQRRVEDEEIEDGDASRDVRMDDDDEDQDQDRSRRTANRFMSKSLPPGEDNDDDDDDDEDDPELPKINVDDFSDVPLDKSAQFKLEGALKDWKMAQDRLKSTDRNPFAVVTRAAEAVAEYGDDRADDIIKQLDSVMRELIDASNEIEGQRNVLQGLRQRIMTGEEISDIIDQWEGGVNGYKGDYARKTSRQKYAKDAQYLKFREGIWNTQHNDAVAMPPISTLIEREDGDEEDSDDEVEVGGKTQDFKDPLSLTTLENPVTSKKCKHSYSKTIISEYLKRGEQKCPYAGCGTKIKLSDLQDDEELARRVAAYTRRQKRRDAEDVGNNTVTVDDDEIIE